MALKFLYTGHNYSNSSTSTFTAQFTTVTDIFGSVAGGIPDRGRFANTAGTKTGSDGFGGQGHATIMTNSYDLYSNKVVRVAMDVELSSRTTQYNWTRWLVGFTNGILIFPTVLQNDVITATQQSDQYCSIYVLSNNKVALRSTTSLLATSNMELMTDIFYRLEVEANLQSAGSFKLWINDQLEIDYTGDVTSGQDTGKYRVRFGDQAVVNGTTVVWDDQGVGFSGYLGDFEPIQILPSGAGLSTQGTPVGNTVNWQAVDETFRNGTTDYVLLNANTTQKDLYEYSNTSITGNVISVAAIPAVWLTTTGIGRISFETSSNGSNGNSLASERLGGLAASTIYGSAIEALEIPVDPNTGNAWTIDAINNAQFGVSAKT